MRLNISLLYLFIIIFSMIEIAHFDDDDYDDDDDDDDDDDGYSNNNNDDNDDNSNDDVCNYSNLLRVSPSNTFVQPRTIGKWSRFRDGKYIIAGRDFVFAWIKILDPHSGITLNYKYLEEGDMQIYLQAFGKCLQKHRLKRQGSLELDMENCECDHFYEQNEEYYLPIKVWTQRDVYSISFEQESEILEIYLFKEEAETWNNMPTCSNVGIMEQLSGTKNDAVGVSKMESAIIETARGENLKVLYNENDIDYANLEFTETTLMLIVKDWSLAKPYVLIELQDGKRLDQSVEIQIEVNGDAPDVNAAELISDNTGLKITFDPSHCLQSYKYVGILRFVIKTSVAGKLRASFYYPDGTNYELFFGSETLRFFEEKIDHFRSNNHFTSYWITYIPPTTTQTPSRTTRTRYPTPPREITRAPTNAPPTEASRTSPQTTTTTTTTTTALPSSTAEIPSTTQNQAESSTAFMGTYSTTQSSNETDDLPKPAAQNGDTAGNDNDDCDGFSTFFWLMIICICIDIILAIILVLLIIFAHRGSKKMKAVMAKKKKDPKTIAAASKQAISPAQPPTSPMKKAKGKKAITEKSTEDETKPMGKTTDGGAGKTTDGKTTTFYTVDQTHYYTVDTTFDKSKKGKN